MKKQTLTIIKSDIERVKNLIEQDCKDSLKNGTTIKKWLKIVEKVIEPHKIFEPFKNYFINFAHVIALENDPRGYSKLK